MATVTILEGNRCGKVIRNQKFTLLKGYTPSGSGLDGFVTVDGAKLYGRDQVRIRVKSSSDYVIDGELPVVHTSRTAVVEAPEPESTETDEEILERINERFDILGEMTLGARSGDIPGIFVTGAPGVGKTHIVESKLKEAGVIEQFSNELPTFQIVSGAMKPVGLYMKLYEFRERNCVLVLDDCDDVFNDVLTLNVLKAALDTKPVRTIHWNVDSSVLRRGLPGGGVTDVPNSFDFKGSVIFISNADFKKTRGDKRNHMMALMSRAHFVDLTIHTTREKLLRIQDLVERKDLLAKFKLDQAVCKKISKFIVDHAEEFNELSLRTVIKLGGLARRFEENDKWMRVAKMSMMGNKM